MNRIYIYLTIILLTSCSPNDSKKTIDKTSTTAITDTSILQPTIKTPGWKELKGYIGSYSKDTDFFKNPIIATELKRILGADWMSYQDHFALSGCGEIEYRYGLMYGDVSQLHVGGYTSLFFVDINDKKMYLFWLKGTVGRKDYKIYGDNPIPASVLNLIEQEMNITWGHVATFIIKGDSIDIQTK
jgi:hypothetical protein